MPWQKGVYGGEIVFETGGVVYSLRRTFGKKQVDDEFLLVRKILMLNVMIFRVILEKNCSR